MAVICFGLILLVGLVIAHALGLFE